MELVNQHTKHIMEGCKDRAREAGLSFEAETLEYIVTNRDLLELTPKNMIPTLYDYWVHDVEVLKEKGRYELYPNNPYETVINTRPAVSFYNDNNPDWLNVMIFYHVIAHIDFFQNNLFFRHTWDEDFAGQALSDKRFIAMLRSEKGRDVDYVIEFARGIDNIVGFYSELSTVNHPSAIKTSKKIDYYFDLFLQKEKGITVHEYLKEIERYNETVKNFDAMGEPVFFSEVAKRYPEFEALFEKHKKRQREATKDLLQYLQQYSPFLQKEENKWMKPVLQIVRNTSLFFQPQIRTKILNEGWASYWHEKLFLQDNRINGNEVGFARVNAKVTALPRVGINPYALGMKLFEYVERLGDHGKFSHEFQRIQDIETRKHYDLMTGKGMEDVFRIRENFSDFMFINDFVDQDFVDRNRLFVAGKRLNSQKGVWEYYVKSRNADDYKQTLLDSLYHPPFIEVDQTKSENNILYLNHRFEGKPLVKEFIHNTMLGLEYLWGNPVKLETTEVISDNNETNNQSNYFSTVYSEPKQSTEKDLKYQRVLYTMKDRTLSKGLL